MLHDPSGQDWPKDSLLVCAFRRGRRPADDQTAKHYLGREYQAHVGSVQVPPRELTSWKRVGDIATIYYERPGTKAPGRYYHHFGKRRLEALFKKGNAVLYKRGSAYRVELGAGSVADDRGLVFP